MREPESRTINIKLIDVGQPVQPGDIIQAREDEMQS